MGATIVGSGRAMDLDRARLLVKAARLYYEQDMTQAEISERLRLSRQKVQRFLDQARAEGIVTIAIHPITGTFCEMERALENRFELSEALVVEISGSDDQNTIARQVGAGAADYLLRLVRPDDKVVLSWGNTLLGMVNALASRSRIPMQGVQLIQGVGSLGNPNEGIHGAELVRRAAKALGTQPVLLPAPAVAASVSVRNALYTDPYVSQTLELGRSADLAFVGIGSTDRDSITLPELWQTLAPNILPALIRKGAVGSINLRYFNEDGRVIKSKIDDRIIGLSLNEIKKIQRVVAVAGGAGKLRAIRAALRTQLVNVLITDHLTAKALLALP